MANNNHKQALLCNIIAQLEADIQVAEQAVQIARDTATHQDCLGSSKYETMGTEASYLAKGQGERLVELQRAWAYFKQVKPIATDTIQLISLVTLDDEAGCQKKILLAADAGGLRVQYMGVNTTVITIKSPLGRALLGKEEGDDITLSMAGKQQCYHIVEVC